MKSLVMINLCVALLLASVSIGVQGASITEILNNMANKGKSIDRVFKPTKNGFLGNGSFGVTYKGILLLNGMEVAMKFKSDKVIADKEYKIYTCLNAINNQNVEAFGIPSIYYYGTWNNHTMMAMTLLDPTFNERLLGNKINKIDVLITIREYVRITKYIHSHGVYQNDFKLEHMMYRKHLGFLYDFNIAFVFSNGTREDRLWAAQEDWKKFFVVVRKYIVQHWDWLGFDSKTIHDLRRMEYDNLAPELLNDSKTPKKLNGLRKIFIELAKYAYGGTEVLEIPFYDLMYQTIVEEIEKLAKKEKMPAVPSWLSTTDKNAAILANDSIPSISDIQNPFGLDRVEYMVLNYDFFNEFYYDKLNEEPELEKKSKKSGFKFWKTCLK